MTTFMTTLDSSLVRELMPADTGGVSPRPGGAEAPFADLLGDMVGRADAALHRADEATTAFARGQQHDLHGTMLALNQANIRLQLVNETRNHLLEAYREVMRMTV